MENFGFLVTFANQVKWKTTIELIMCSGGLTLVRTKGQVNVDLAMLIGVGVGKNVGLLLAHGKTESTLAQRRHRVGRKTRLVKTNVLKIGPDRSVKPVESSTGHKIGPVQLKNCFCIEPVLNRSNRRSDR